MEGACGPPDCQARGGASNSGSGSVILGSAQGAVARYFFNIVEDDHAVDSIGVECADAELARMEAIRFAADMLRREPERVWKGAELRIEAADAWGTVLFTLIIVGVDAEALQRHK
jgi:hypothetical protein